MTLQYFCDRCGKKLDQYYSYRIEENYHVLCRDCTELIKGFLRRFWDNNDEVFPEGRVAHIPKNYPNREKTGSELKYDLLPRVKQKSIPPTIKKPNAIVRLFYWLFYKEVKKEE